MKHNYKRSGFIAGILCAALLASVVVPGWAASQVITAYDTDMKVYVDGVAVDSKDANGNPSIIVYNGSSYIASTAIGKSLDKKVVWDESAWSVYIQDDVIATRPETDKNAMLPKYSYQLNGVQEVTGRQGITTDGEYYYVSGSTTLVKYDSNWNEVARNEKPFEEGYSLEVNHIGDIDVYNGELYLGVEYFMDGVGTNIQIAIYDTETLTLKRTFPFDESTGQLECSGITVNPDDNVVTMCSWVGEESGRYLYEYDLTTGAFQRKIHLQCPPQWVQGVLYYDGSYYLTADDGTADEKEADHLYRVDINDGTSATVVLERTFDDVIFQGEIEGLAINPKTNQFLLLYNRGSQIVLGMVKGFYPGYTREITEVFIYDMSKA